MKLCLTKWVSFEIKLYLCTAFLAREGEEINNFFVSLFNFQCKSVWQITKM